METKLSKVVCAIKCDDWETALKIANRFHDLGTEKEAITRAASALLHPDFYRQLKKDPVQLVIKGKEALTRRYARYIK